MLEAVICFFKFITSLEVLGFFTVLLSFIGMIVATLHTLFFMRSTEPMAKHIKNVFMSDALIYGITFAFGAFTYFGVDPEDFATLYAIRLIFLTLNICAGIRLYHHYKAYRTQVKGG